MLLLGPAWFLPSSLQLMSFSFLILGFTLANLAVMTYTELTKSSKELFPDEKLDVSDFCASVQNCAQGLGQTFGYNFGAQYYQKFGFQKTETTMSLISLVLTASYLLTCNGFKAFASLFQPKSSVNI